MKTIPITDYKITITLIEPDPLSDEQEKNAIAILTVAIMVWVMIIGLIIQVAE